MHGCACRPRKPGCFPPYASQATFWLRCVPVAMLSASTSGGMSSFVAGKLSSGPSQGKTVRKCDLCKWESCTGQYTVRFCSRDLQRSLFRPIVRRRCAGVEVLSDMFPKMLYNLCDSETPGSSVLGGPARPRFAPPTLHRFARQYPGRASACAL